MSEQNLSPQLARAGKSEIASPELLRVLRDALGSEEAWLVGGALRDRLLGRQVFDYDIAVTGDARALARKVAKTLGGHAFELSDEFETWRVTAKGESWQVDLAKTRGGGIDTDLAARDFTINAMAQRVGSEELIDPFGGRADLEAGRLAMVNETALFDDPLRTLRAVRIAVELELAIDPQTAQTIREAAGELRRTAQERIFAELKRIIASDAPRAAIELLDGLGLGEQVFPELFALKGLEQNKYHHADAYEHTLAALDELLTLEADPAVVGFPEQTAEISSILSEILADELTHAQALRFVVLLHDLGKPASRAIDSEGRVVFSGHHQTGAELAETILRRWRASTRLIQYSKILIEHHLDVGFMANEPDLSRRSIWRFLCATEPYATDVVLLTAVDRLATRGASSEKAIPRHLKIAEELLTHSFAHGTGELAIPLIRGDELAHEIGIKPGPALGEILKQLAEDRFIGEVGTRSEAVERARTLANKNA